MFSRAPYLMAAGLVILAGYVIGKMIGVWE